MVVTLCLDCSHFDPQLVPGDLQSDMASVIGIDRPTSAPPPLNTAANGRLGPLPLSTSRLESTLSSPGLPTATRTAPSTSRAKGMQLGASKVPISVTNAALAAELTAELNDEAETDTLNAWGSDDLMDVNADDGDWSAFESAPLSAPLTAPVARVPKAVPVVGLGFGDVLPSVYVNGKSSVLFAPITPSYNLY